MKFKRKPPAPEASISQNKSKEINLTDLVLLDSLELSTLLHISQRSLYKYRRDQLIPYIRIQGRIYYRLSDVFASLEYFKLKNHLKIRIKK